MNKWVPIGIAAAVAAIIVAVLFVPTGPAPIAPIDCDDYAAELSETERTLVRNFEAELPGALGTRIEGVPGNGGVSARTEAILRQTYRPNALPLPRITELRIRARCDRARQAYDVAVGGGDDGREALDAFNRDLDEIQKEMEAARAADREKRRAKYEEGLRTQRDLRTGCERTARESNALAPQLFEVRGGARANSPGIGGGRKRDERTVCLSVPATHEIVEGPSIERLSCFSGRCSHGEIEPRHTDDMKNFCVQVRAWSESKSFGGGGSHQIRLFARAAVPVDDAGIAAACLQRFPDPDDPDDA